MASGVHCQHRVAHGGQQGLQLQAPAVAGQEVDQRHLLHTVHPQQGGIQLIQHDRGQRRGIDIDVGRNHFYRVQVEVARPK
ncbi:hypothetical protein D3C79_1069800 [compost metagenome]